MTLDFRVLFQVCEHDNKRDTIMIDHAPKVLNCCLQGTLSCDEKLIVPTYRRIDVIRIDVRVVDVFISLYQADSRMLDCSLQTIELAIWST